MTTRLTLKAGPLDPRDGNGRESVPPCTRGRRGCAPPPARPGAGTVGLQRRSLDVLLSTVGRGVRRRVGRGRFTIRCLRRIPEAAVGGAKVVVENGHDHRGVVHVRVGRPRQVARPRLGEHDRHSVLQAGRGGGGEEGV